MNIQLRAELPGDHAAIHAVTEAAFRNMPFSDGGEADLISMLRADGDLALSLIALDHGNLIGHIAFSPVRISDGTTGWYGLGPVSVLPQHQGQGIGSKLIHAGLDQLRGISANGCVLLGNPGFYSRFGFKHDPRLQYPGPPAEYFQYLLFQGEMPEGVVAYASAFG